MNSPFFETSKNIANQFLQNIVFIDDKAFMQTEKTNHDFDALKISQVFAESQKVCAVYKPSKLNDIDNLIELVKKADVTVLDWQIIIKQEHVENEDEDAEEDDPRGPHTKRIIRSILTDTLKGQGSLKLIVIYTGEIDLNGITDEIYKDLVEHEISDLKKVECQVYKDNLRIFVIAKPDMVGKGEAKFKHAPELNKYVIEYEQLPDFILTRFAEMTTGLLTNFALNSLIVLRRNTSRLINLFSKDLDSAFLTHRSLLPNPEDASEQLIEVVGSELKSMLRGNDVSELISIENISNYLDTIINSDVNFNINEKEKFQSITIPDKLTIDNLKTIVQHGVNSFFLKKSDPYEEVQLFEKNCHKTLIDSFTADTERGHKSNVSFASLTTLKSFYNDDFIPFLTQGTILKDEKNNNEYYLCVQPKCDSVRIHTKSRDFLLLRLYNVIEEKSFDIAIDETTKLKIDYSIFKSKLIAFKSTNGKVISIVENGTHKKFERWDNKKMIWVGELKNDFAQSISNSFAAKIARVGMDHSEWLRRS